MKYRTVRSHRLTDEINSNEIYSITIMNPISTLSNVRGKRYLLVAFKDGYTKCISLSQFTYSLPCGIPIPREQYDLIKLITKEVSYDGYRYSDSFVQATITKPISWCKRQYNLP